MPRLKDGVNVHPDIKWHHITWLGSLKGHCIEFKYYADGIHSGLTPPGNNS